MMKKYIATTAICLAFTACSDQNPSGGYPPRNESAADQRPTASASEAKDVSLEEKMATLAFDQTPTKAQLKRTTVALDNAKALCVESRDELGDRAYVVAKILLEKNVSVNSIEILEGVATTNADTLDGFLNAKERPHVCSETMAAYAVARTSGMTHTDAVLGGRGVLLLPQRLQSFK